MLCRVRPAANRARHSVFNRGARSCWKSDWYLNSCPKALGWLSNCWGSRAGRCYLLTSLPSLCVLQLLTGCSVIVGKGWHSQGLWWASKLKPPLLWCCICMDNLPRVLAPAAPLVAVSSSQLGSCAMAVSLFCCDHPVSSSCNVLGLILGLPSLVLPHALPPGQGMEPTAGRPLKTTLPVGQRCSHTKLLSCLIQPNQAAAPVVETPRAGRLMGFVPTSC